MPVNPGNSRKAKPKADTEKTASHRKRKIVQPPRRGTISRSIIRKVIQEVIAKRPAHP